MSRLRIVYDGDCPFCANYVALLRVQETHEVELLDARQAPEIAGSYGLDLNDGMILDESGRVYHGAEAVWRLSQLSRRPALLSSLRLARMLYPAMRLGRSLTLRLLGRDAF